MTIDWANKKVLIELSGQDLDWIQTGLALWDFESRESKETAEEIEELYQRLGHKLTECGFEG